MLLEAEVKLRCPACRQTITMTGISTKADIAGVIERPPVGKMVTTVGPVLTTSLVVLEWKMETGRVTSGCSACLELRRQLRDSWPPSGERSGSVTPT